MFPGHLSYNDAEILRDARRHKPDGFFEDADALYDADDLAGRAGRSPARDRPHAHAAAALCHRDAGALPPAALEDLIGQVKGLDMDDVRQQVAEANAARDAEGQ